MSIRINHPPRNECNHTSTVPSWYLDAYTDALPIFVQSTKRVVACYILFPGLPFHFGLKPSRIFNGIAPFMKKPFLAMGMSTLCIKKKGIKFAVITMRSCFLTNCRILNRIKCAMAKWMMRPGRCMILFKPAPIQFQTLLAMRFPFIVVRPLNPFRASSNLRNRIDPVHRLYNMNHFSP